MLIIASLTSFISHVSTFRSAEKIKELDDIVDFQDARYSQKLKD